MGRSRNSRSIINGTLADVDGSVDFSTRIDMYLASVWFFDLRSRNSVPIYMPAPENNGTDPNPINV